MKKSLLAFSTHVGTTVGVGLFGLPWVAAQAGFWPTVVYFGVLTFVVMILQYLFAEISLQFVNDHHQLPGYTERFLGKKYKSLAMIMMALSIYGALLAYIIIGGEFTYQLFAPYLGGTLLMYQIGFFLIGSAFIYQGIHSVAKTEFVMMIVFLAIIFLLFIISIPKIELTNFQTFEPKNIFLPYGVIIFSLWGLSIIPALKEILKQDTKKLKNVVKTSVIFCTAIYIIFIVSVLGVSGSETSLEALNGLVPFLSNKILAVGYAFGILTTFTSFIALGIVQQDSYMKDYNLTKPLSWFLSLFPPLAVFSLGITNFLYVMNVTGAITLAVQGVLVSLIYLRLLKTPKYDKKIHIRVSKYTVYAVTVILTLGILTQLYFMTLGR